MLRKLTDAVLSSLGIPGGGNAATWFRQISSAQILWLQNTGAKVYGPPGLAFWTFRDVPMDIAVAGGSRNDPIWDSARYFSATGYVTQRLIRAYAVVEVAPVASGSAAGAAILLGRDAPGDNKLINATGLGAPTVGSVYGLLDTEKGTDLPAAQNRNGAYSAGHVFHSTMTAAGGVTWTGGVLRYVVAWEAPGPVA